MNLGGADTVLKSANTGLDTTKPSSEIHIRMQQRNTRKSLTTVSGIDSKYNFNKILKALKRNLNANGTVLDDEHGKIILLQGDHRFAIAQFLYDNGLADKDQIKMHGA